MFNSITGILTEKGSESVFLTTQGIEWEVYVSSITIDRLPSVETEVRLFLWLYHREDAMRLFGFIDRRERQLFFDLLRVNGIGAKQAIKILSHISCNDLERALNEADLGRLETVPGLGKKTAQKMVLALKGHLTDSPTSGQKKSAAHQFEDILQALVGMGFDRRQAAEQLDKISAKTMRGEKAQAVYEDELFRAAIVALSAR